MRKITLAVTAGLLLGLVTACAKAPQEEITAVRSAMEEARSADASEYAPQSMQAAEDAQARLEAELKAQESKFALFRSYKKADELAAEAKTAAAKAGTDAAEAKQQKMEEATAAISDTRSLLEETRTALAKAPRGKGTQADIAAMGADLDGAESALNDADAALSSEDYLGAIAKAGGAQTTIDNVKSAIDAAIAARTRRRR